MSVKKEVGGGEADLKVGSSVERSSELDDKKNFELSEFYLETRNISRTEWKQSKKEER